MQNLPVVIMGLTSILMQIVALRRLLSLLAGNELVIGVTLAVWLGLVGVGSFLGRRLKSGRAFAVSFLAVALLALPSVLFPDFIPFLFSLEPGETMSLSNTITASVLTLLPLCLVLGSQFPLAVSHCSGKASKAYGLEAAGAFIGGALFTFALAGRVSSPSIALSVGILNVLAAAVLLKKKLVVLLAAVPIAIFSWVGTAGTFVSNTDLQLLQKAESRYGELSVYRSGDQSNVYAGGKFLFSYPDPQTEEMKVHVPFSLHASPSTVLVIGGSPGTLRLMLKYPVAAVDFVEIDPRLIDISLAILSQEDLKTLGDKRLKIVTADARRFVKTAPPSRYDLALVNLPEPSTANINRFYTVNFFREVRASMKQDGILCLGLPASYGYIGRRMQAANGTVFHSLHEVFAHVGVSSEDYGGIYASNAEIATDPAMVSKRFTERGITASFFFPELFTDIFDPLKTNMVKTRLEKVQALNTDQRPLAYLYNLKLWAEAHGGRVLNTALGLGERRTLLAMALVFLPAMALLGRKKHAVRYTLFTTGYVTMALSIVVLLSYQAAYGYVYEALGLITAMFMAGSAAGAFLASRFRRCLRWLLALDMAAVLALIASPLFVTSEFLYYVLSLLFGVMGGMQFAAAGTWYAGEDRQAETGGKLYAIDIAGSFLGALLTAVFFVPLLGIGQVVWSLAAIKGSSLVLLLSLGHEKN